MTELNLRMESLAISLKRMPEADIEVISERIYSWLTRDIDHDVRLRCMEIAVCTAGDLFTMADYIYERIHDKNGK